MNLNIIILLDNNIMANKTNINDYFSDDDQVIDEPTDEEEYLDEEDSLDEETRQLIYNTAFKNIDYENLSVKEVTNKAPAKRPDTKGLNKLSLIDFTKKVDDDEKSRKPKKFVSQRREDKKKELGVSNDIPKRHFNPRMTPYNFINRQNKNSKVNLNNTDEFPIL